MTGTYSDSAAGAIYRALIVLSIVVLSQATLLPRVRLLGVTPNLLLTTVLCWSLVRGFEEGIVWGFAGGLGFDLIAGMPLGTTSLAVMSTCFLADLSKSTLFARSLILPMLVVAMATPIYGWIVLLIWQLRGLPVDWLGSTVRVILPEALLNSLLALPVYPALHWLAEKSRGVEAA